MSWDWSRPIELARPVVFDDQTTRAFDLPAARRRALYATDDGGSVNCDVLELCAHGAGTHTESARHIGNGPYVWRAAPAGPVDAWLVDDENLADVPEGTRALVVRTGHVLENYSGTDPRAFSVAFIEGVRARGIEHLLTDLPSLDRETDATVPAHRAFFSSGGLTVTELCAIPAELPPGPYGLVLHVPALDTDAAPSRPVLFPGLLGTQASGTRSPQEGNK